MPKSKSAPKVSPPGLMAALPDTPTLAPLAIDAAIKQPDVESNPDNQIQQNMQVYVRPKKNIDDEEELAKVKDHQDNNDNNSITTITVSDMNGKLLAYSIGPTGQDNKFHDVSDRDISQKDFMKAANSAMDKSFHTAIKDVETTFGGKQYASFDAFQKSGAAPGGPEGSAGDVPEEDLESDLSDAPRPG